MGIVGDFRAARRSGAPLRRPLWLLPVRLVFGTIIHGVHVGAEWLERKLWGD